MVLISRVISRATMIIALIDVGCIFLVPPKGHPRYTLTTTKKEPYIHSPKTVM